MTNNYFCNILQVGQDSSEPLDVKTLTISSNGVQTRVPALVCLWVAKYTIKGSTCLASFHLNSQFQ